MKEIPSPPLNFNSVQILKNKNKEAQQAYHKRIEEETRLIDVAKGAQIKANIAKYVKQNNVQLKFDLYATKLVYEKKSVQDIIRSKIKKCDQARHQSIYNKESPYQEHGNDKEITDLDNDLEDRDESNEIGDTEALSLEPPDLSNLLIDHEDIPSDLGCETDTSAHLDDDDHDDEEDEQSMVEDDVSIANSTDERNDQSICADEDDDDDEQSKTCIEQDYKTKEKIQKALWKKGETVMCLPSCQSQREAVKKLLECQRNLKATFAQDISFWNDS